MSKGILYIVSTPIGNMSDMTLRAIETLKNVDLVLSEDTRETGKLFKHYQIDKRQISYRDQNHARVLADIKALLDTGSNLALVSDAGTPLISDPGYKLVNELVKAAYPIEVIPGASAVTSALVLSGLPTDKFSFLGFLPKSDGAKKDLLDTFGQLDATLIVFESPYRLISLLELAKETLGDRICSVVGEITKMHQKIFTGKINDVINDLKVSPSNTKGEFVVLFAKKDYEGN